MRSLWFLILLAINKSSSYPSRPLNERSTELTWQAWLLVDQSRQNDLGMFRKRITPKSVFIAPTFSPESLPECAEGYKSDTMGRCVKIIKINEDAHLDFLLHKLNEQFGEFGDYEDEPDEAPATQGPFQVNIPLEGNFNEDYRGNEADIAIVLTPRSPTSTISNNKNHSVIRNNNTHKQKFNIENVAEILGVNPKDVETTTLKDFTITTTTSLPFETETITTTNVVTTEMPAISTISTIPTTDSEDLTTVSTQETTQTVTPTTLKDFKETTTLEGEALFFQWRGV